MTEQDPTPEGPKRTHLIDDLNEVMPDAMATLSSRVRIYMLWVVFTAVVSAVVVMCSDDEAPDAQETSGP